jgi:hypothetical protein
MQTGRTFSIEDQEQNGRTEIESTRVDGQNKEQKLTLRHEASYDYLFMHTPTTEFFSNNCSV